MWKKVFASTTHRVIEPHFEASRGDTPGRGSKGFGWHGSGNLTTTSYPGLSAQLPNFNFYVGDVYLALQIDPSKEIITAWQVNSELLKSHQTFQDTRNVRIIFSIHILILQKTFFFFNVQNMISESKLFKTKN